MVSAVNHLLKGFVAGGGDSGLLGAPMEFIFKWYKIDGGRMQVYMAIATSPWALKPLIGLLSDSLPIYGFRKMPYILITSFAGLCSALALGTFGYELSLGMVVFCLFLAFLMVATADLLVEARQSAEVKSSAELGPDFFLFTWLGIVIGMILATLCVGPLIQYWSPHSCYLVALPFIAISLWPTVMNYMGEKELQDNESVFARIASNLKRHPEMSSLCIGMGLLLVAITVVTFTVREDAEKNTGLGGDRWSSCLAIWCCAFHSIRDCPTCDFLVSIICMSKSGWSFILFLHRR
jgi:MFS family permease